MLEQPDDAFMLTVEELLEPEVPAGAGELASSRRSAHERYRALDIPDLFYGVPEAFPIGASDEAADVGDRITGTAVSPGVVTGPARVLLDPRSDEPLEAGEILVCRTTDPSWASAMMVASALVIDIGGPISHGAIVARELGIPCSIGTRNAAKRIATGDILEVNGGTGEVRIVRRAADVAAHTPAAPASVAVRDPTNEPDEGREVMSETIDDQLPILRALSLKGRAGTSDLAGATGLLGEDVAAAADALVNAGLARTARDAYMLTPEGRAALDELLTRERAGVDPQVPATAYDAFTPINDRFKALANDWQTRDGEPNDHTDAAYDAEVIGRLPGIHHEVMALIAEVARAVPRLRVYGERFRLALERVQRGDHTWLLRPLIDSYHTVWFELHEELISLSGRNRLEEAAAGRAH